jgi:hypothetical protein
MFLIPKCEGLATQYTSLFRNRSTTGAFGCARREHSWLPNTCSAAEILAPSEESGHRRLITNERWLLSRTWSPKLSVNLAASHKDTSEDGHHVDRRHPILQMCDTRTFHNTRCRSSKTLIYRKEESLYSSTIDNALEWDSLCLAITIIASWFHQDGINHRSRDILSS